MTIASEISRLQGAKANICTAIENKGVTVGNITLDQYCDCINAISGGGGGYCVDALVVGGGGGGKGTRCLQQAGGGGGAGGAFILERYPVESETQITIGAGGCGIPYNGSGNTGGDTCFGELIAYGGGGGGYAANVGCNGGSGGGGGGRCCTAASIAGGCGCRGIISCQGNNGGCGCSITNAYCMYGGGGGGAGGPGDGKNGGYGIISNISGSCVCYAGGGGGAGGCCVSSGVGRYGGGNGCCQGNGGNATRYGSGGGGSIGNNYCGGNGCQGVVIIRYPADGSYGFSCATGGTKTAITVGGVSYCKHTFTSDGTFTIVS